MSYLYLASPYSHKNMDVMKWRYEVACKTAAHLMAQGHAVFSPIAHSHPIAEFMNNELRTDFEFWMTQDLPILRFAKQLCVLMLDGWKESRGVTREIEYAKVVGVPTVYIEVPV